MNITAKGMRKHMRRRCCRENRGEAREEQNCRGNEETHEEEGLQREEGVAWEEQNCRGMRKHMRRKGCRGERKKQVR
jgi:hypothetical protein